MNIRVMDLVVLYAQDKIEVVESGVAYEFEVDDLLTEFPDTEVVALFGNTNGTVTIKLDTMEAMVQATWLELYGED